MQTGSERGAARCWSCEGGLRCWGMQGFTSIARSKGQEQGLHGSHHTRGGAAENPHHERCGFWGQGHVRRPELILTDRDDSSDGRQK